MRQTDQKDRYSDDVVSKITWVLILIVKHFVSKLLGANQKALVAV
jgi:hypothetical protein